MYFIVPICVFSILISLYIFITIYAKKLNEKEKYEFKTYPTKKLTILINLLFFGIGIGLILLSFVLLLIERYQKGYLIITSVGGGFGLLALLVHYSIHVQYDAIQGGYLYYRRFTKLNTLLINEIHSIEIVGASIVIITNSGGKLTIDSHTGGAIELFERIKTRISDLIYNYNSYIPEERKPNEEETRIQLEKEKETLSLLGQEYRNNYNTVKKNYIISMSSLLLCISLILVLLSIYFRSIILGVISAILIVIIIFVGIVKPLSTKKEELKNSDEWLGYNYRNCSKKLKGASKQRLKKNLIFVSISFIITLGIAILYLTLSSSKPLDKEILKEVDVQVEYREKSKDYIHLGLKTYKTEYRVASYALAYLEDSFLEEINPGDIITILIDPKEQLKGMTANNRTAWAYTYGIKTNDKTYLSYDEYVEGFTKHNTLGKALGYVSLSISLIYLGFGIASIYLYKKDSKEETIEL